MADIGMNMAADVHGDGHLSVNWAKFGFCWNNVSLFIEWGKQFNSTALYACGLKEKNVHMSHVCSGIV